MQKGVAKRREAERQERIDRILRAARKVFLKKGYHGATMRDIAAKSDLSTGAIYFYFNGKDEIYGRLCEDVMHLTLRELRKGLRPDAPTAERLEAIISAYIGFYLKYRDDFDLLETGFKQVTLPEESSRRLDKLVEESLTLVNHVFEDAVRAGDIGPDIDTWELTMAVWAAFEGLIYIHKREFLKDTHLELDRIIQTQMRIFLKGMGIPMGK